MASDKTLEKKKKKKLKDKEDLRYEDLRDHRHIQHKSNKEGGRKKENKMAAGREASKESGGATDIRLRPERIRECEEFERSGMGTIGSSGGSGCLARCCNLPCVCPYGGQ